MVTFSAYHTTTLYEACQTVLELIDEISNIPIEYLRAMGLAMVSFVWNFPFRQFVLTHSYSYKSSRVLATF